jgi:proteic killer suppression protein
MHGRILRRLDRLDVIVRPEEMNLPGFDFHSLRGFRPTRYSVHINGPWCITFEFEDGEVRRVTSSNITRGKYHGSCRQA